MAKITTSDVEHVAHLARLSFDANEIDAFTRQLNDIIEFVDMLDALDTSGVEPTTRALELLNVFRNDEVKPSLSVEQATANAPVAEDGAFVVPRII